MADESRVAKVREYIELAQKSGDSEKERKGLHELQRLTQPSMNAPGGTIEPMEMDPGLMNGEARRANYVERVFNQELQTPESFLPYALATIASFIPGAGAMALPAIMSRLGPLSKPVGYMVQQSPKIAATATGGGLGTAGQEALQGGDINKVLRAGQKGFIDYGLAEAGGQTAGGLLGKLTELTLGKFNIPKQKIFDLVKKGDDTPETKQALEKIAKNEFLDTSEGRALMFARENKAPLPLSILKGTGAGRAGSAASDVTVFGRMLRINAADKIDDMIKKNVDAITPFAKPSEVIAPQTQQLFKGILDNTTDAKDVAYGAFEAAIGKNTPVDATAIRLAAQNALQVAKAQGKSITGKLQELENFANYEGPRMFSDLEQFRKLTLKPLFRSSKMREVSEPLMRGFDDFYTQLGKQKGVDLTGDIAKAEKAMTELSNLEKIPGLLKFSKEISSNEGYIISLVNENNTELLKYLQKQSPDIYKSLTQQRLGLSFFNKEGTWAPQGFMKYIRSNPRFIQETYGDETARVLNNFADYIDLTSKYVKDNAGKNMVDSAMMRGITTGGLGYVNPWAAGITEGGGIALATMLTNPKTQIYRIFTETDPIKISKAIKTAVPFITRSMVGGEDGQ